MRDDADDDEHFHAIAVTFGLLFFIGAIVLGLVIWAMLAT